MAPQQQSVRTAHQETAHLLVRLLLQQVEVRVQVVIAEEMVATEVRVVVLLTAELEVLAHKETTEEAV
jgi:hypothetical protein